MIDDGSADNSVEIIKSYDDHTQFPILSPPNSYNNCFHQEIAYKTEWNLLP
jgi:hypothetical protein